ncbi:MAG TPA: ATP-binding cassette domain-containing protein, partial [Gemmatimonadales bacterium]
MIPLPCTVIEGIGVTKHYGRAPVLRGIDFAVKAGRVTAILGPNGAGKSTLIRMLLGLARPDEGSV